MTTNLTILLALATNPIQVESFYLLKAIGYVESNEVDSAIGKHGERGRFQFTLATWTTINRQRKKQGFMTVPYDRATNPIVAFNYANEWLQYIHTRLAKRLGRPPTCQEIYAVWNLGFDGFRRLNFHLDKVPATTKRAISKLETHLQNL